MATDANIRAVITADDRASKVLSKFGDHVNNEAERASSGFDNFTKRLAIGATIAGVATTAITKGISLITDSVGEAVSRVDTLNNANRTFANMGFTAKETKKAMDDLNKSILGLPTSLNDAVTNVELLASATGDISRSEKLFKALNDGILGFGGSADQVNTAVIQLSQAFAGGRVYAQDWNSMLNAGLGPALNAIAKQMGITMGTMKESLSDGSIDVGKFQDALIQLDEKGGGGLKSLDKIAKDSTSGMATGMANAQTAIVRGIADIIKAFGSADISSAITGVGKAAESSLKSIAGLIGGVKEFANQTVNYLTPGLQSFIGVVQEVAAILKDILGPPLEQLWNTIATNVLPQVKELWAAIEPGFTQALKVMAAVLGAIVTVQMWVWINVLNVAWGVIGFGINVVSSLTKWIGNLGGVAVNAAEAMLNAFKAAFNAISGLWNKSIGKIKLNIPSWVPGIGGKGFDVPDIPMLAEGGIVTKPTLAMIGEAGAEAVVPLKKGGMNPGGNINININAGALMGTDVEARKFAQLILNHLKDSAASRNMTLGQMIG